MKKQDYSTSIPTNATPKESFKCVNSVSKWWTENIEGSSQNPDGIFTVRFGTTWKTFKIIEFVPDKKVVWQVTDCNMPWNKNKTEWKNTKIVWEVSKKDNKTQIRFTHLGLVPDFECFDACSNAWTDYLQNSLKNLITTGKGQPNPREDKPKAAKKVTA